MYSPKIPEPMTRVHAAALEAYLATQEAASEDTRRPCRPARRRPRSAA
jgi:hypothetical protein